MPAGAPVAAETALRLGHAYALLARPDLALPAFARAEALATTSYELYLTRLLAGAVFARAGRRTEAIEAFQGALQVVPRAQSASFALAPLLLEVGARDAAAESLEAAVRLPLADDPQDHPACHRGATASPGSTDQSLSGWDPRTDRGTSF